MSRRKLLIAWSITGWDCPGKYPFHEMLSKLPAGLDVLRERERERERGRERGREKESIKKQGICFTDIPSRHLTCKCACKTNKQ